MPIEKQDGKVRRKWKLKNSEGEDLASGNLYEEGNIQVLWHKHIGYTGIQYCSISYVLDLFRDGSILEFESLNEIFSEVDNV